MLDDAVAETIVWKEEPFVSEELAFRDVGVLSCSLIAE